MFDTLKKLNTLLSPNERRRAKLVFLLMLIMAFMETIGVASVMPFVSVLANPEILETNRYLASVYELLGFTTSDSFLFFLGVVVFLLFVSSLAFKALTTYAIIRFSSMRLHTIACRLLGAYIRQPTYEYFLGRNTADMGKSILSEVGQVINGVMIPVMRVIAGITVTVALLGFLLYMEPIISLAAALVLGGSYALVYIFTHRMLKQIGEDRLLANQQRYILASEALSGIKELKLLDRAHAYLSRFEDPSERFARHQATTNLISSLPQFAIRAVAFGGIILMILYLLASYGGMKGALPLIALYAFAGYRLMPAFQEIFGNVTRIRFSLPVLETLYSDIVLKEANAYKGKEKSFYSLQLHNSIQLEGVSYRYPAATADALKDITLEISVGSCVGFVGSTGSGKSTIVDLIMGLLSPSSGEVLIDGMVLNADNTRSWQDKIGYVPQSIYLADDTVAANIAFGIPQEKISKQALERAARAAHIHEFITTEMPEGYETVVGERGIRLSGGQRQRLAIARALYYDPDVVVFDEATSALDNATESAVMDAIEDLHGIKTVILIAHRLTTVRICDHIFFLDKGSLIASDTYNGLMKNNAKFQQMAFIKTSKNTVTNL